MKKEKYYWKVVRKHTNNQFLSTIILKGIYCLSYELGKETIAPKQGVFVFNTRKLARGYYRNQNVGCDKNKFKILKVQATGTEITNPNFYDLWKLEQNRIVVCNNSSFPSGTKCFKSIIPIEISR